MKNRISEKFTRLKSENRGGFIPFIMAGDPNLQTTEQLILELERIGASVIELGVPFSDPVADGATIQRSGERALLNRIGIEEILQVIANIRQKGCETPIILFSYFNPILQFGLEKFVSKTKESGADGVLVTDLVPEEAEEFHALLTAENLSLITLAAPTSSDARLEKIVALAGGFVYAVSRAGVTGARTDLSSDAENLVERLRKITNLPVAVGFGISTDAQVAEVWRYADAAVVGSAIVAEMMRLAPNQEEIAADFVAKIGCFAHSLLTD